MKISIYKSGDVVGNQIFDIFPLFDGSESLKRFRTAEKSKCSECGEFVNLYYEIIMRDLEKADLLESRDRLCCRCYNARNKQRGVRKIQGNH